MSSDAPSASWHPALMPNNAPEPAPVESQYLTHATSPSKVEQSQSSERAPSPHRPVEDLHDKSLGPDEWFPEYDTGDKWATQDTSVPQVAPSPSDAVGDSKDNSLDETDQSSADAAKRMSTMSFTRTVPQDVTWADDEDTEWALPKTEADPFRFMSPKDRTNSFPAVPPLERPEDHDIEIEHPLPANQAEDILQEIEQEEQYEHAGLDFAASNETEFTGEAAENGTAPPQYIGGDFSSSIDDGSDTRFAEGLPLISHTKGVIGKHEDPTGTAFRTESTSQFVAEEDDFFSHVRDAVAPEPENPDPLPLERKSTMQVLNGLGTGNVYDSTPLDTPNEREVHLEPLGESDTAGEEALNAEDEVSRATGGEDLDAKWQAMFEGDEDDEFLPDEVAESKEVDPAAFFGSDDEGFLEDTEEPTSQHLQQTPTSPSASASKGLNGRYLPPNQPTQPGSQASKPVLTAYSPTTNSGFTPIQPPYAAAPPASPPSAGSRYGAQIQRPEPSKAQSFADKAKGGYTSPYDLPMEVVKVKKRASVQSLPRTGSAPIAPPPTSPPRVSGTHGQGPTSRSITAASMPPPNIAQPVHQQGSPQKSQAHTLKPKGSFFEELPMSSRPRPGSRQSTQSLPSPSQASPFSPTQPIPPQQHPLSQAHASPAQPPATGIANLVAPPRVSPYASVQTAPNPVSQPPPPMSSSRYSPAPASTVQSGATAPLPPPNRYSPAPTVSRNPSGNYAPSHPPPQTIAATPPLPHQPRTSSPLAHFESNRDRPKVSPVGPIDPNHVDRRSSLYEPRLQRVPSLPPTREVEEEEGLSRPQQHSPASSGHISTPAESPFGQLPTQLRQTPPLPLAAQSTLSPPRRAVSNYSPTGTNAPQDFVPPQRSQTQSPGVLYGQVGVRTVDPVQRPSSVHAHTAPTALPPNAATTTYSTTPAATSSRPRGASQNLNFVAPTDGREQDQLQRWKGVPLVSWGVGGTIVTMFPTNLPRYGKQQSTPMIVRSPGEVKVRSMKDIQPLDERLVKFPGPLKGKSKKKETIAWLTAGIEALEAGMPRHFTFQPQESHDDKRIVERVLLWKILRIFIEHDGALDGNPTVDQAVREALSPSMGGQATVGSPVFVTGASMASRGGASASHMEPDAVAPSTIGEIRSHLLSGDREKAVWAAADKRLWGHAMLIANTVSADLYRKVTQEFVKKEVNYPGHNNESLAALYEVLSGNHEESVDELVPVHARAGLQLITTSSTSNSASGVAEGLDKWQETLSLILSNRSNEDTRAMNSLGNLLSGYGRAEAAHICFIFARNHSVFGGLDDPNSSFVLVGSDHKRQAEQFAKEIEPLLLSEVYEYGLSLAGGSNVAVSSPHLAGYKLQHALTLAEYGYRDKALQYCEAIANSITSQTKRSPYHHGVLETAVDDLVRRLKQAPKEESNSWIPKPSMGKVSDSVWKSFNKFVAGDDNDTSAHGTTGDGSESGPFARVAGGTPTISRPPSAAGVDGFGAGIPGYPMPGNNAPASTPQIPATKAASRYAPMAALQGSAPQPNSYEPHTGYAPRASMERSSGEYNRGSFEMRRATPDVHSGSNMYTPSSTSSPTPAFPQNYSQGPASMSRESSYMPVSQSEEAPSVQQPPSLGASSFGYEPPSQTLSAPSPQLGAANASSVDGNSPNISGYQPPSYGYEPPSFTPYEAPAAEIAEGTKKEPANGAFEQPSYQPYGYEPPSYQPDTKLSQDSDNSDAESKAKPKKKGIMYDDDDDIPSVSAASKEKTKEEKDRENAEMFRKAAEEDAKRAAEAKQAKKGWGLGGWFGGGGSPKKEGGLDAPAGNKPIRAKLGQANSFYYDPDQKRWINKMGGADDSTIKKSTPPPPRGAGGTPPPGASNGAAMGRASAPPGLRPAASVPALGALARAQGAGGPPGPSGLGPGSMGPPAMARSSSNMSNTSATSAGGPPSRPATSMSNASSIDDLIGAAGPRVKGAAKKPRKSGRYVDVMAKP